MWRLVGNGLRVRTLATILIKTTPDVAEPICNVGTRRTHERRKTFITSDRSRRAHTITLTRPGEAGDAETRVSGDSVARPDMSGRSPTAPPNNLEEAVLSLTCITTLPQIHITHKHILKQNKKHPLSKLIILFL
ncbi:hypothetical protein L596_008726 [Steinernema carpocapsae]|uniref:Uncharacterized protein n=1 Tax=Steinernema carpocapsae TaxID=34508 RepID=A0A4U5PDC8_STECR|nr:hypothetical protein L596_008726 [Steinernema carpocapsae]